MPHHRALPLTASLTAIALATATPAGAQTEVATGGDAAEDIIVTGSRGKPRSVLDSPAPIDVLPDVELKKTGQPGVLAALNLLVPSFNVPNRAGGGTSTVIRTGGLRGLNPDQTLILVNGKRRHKTSLINAVSALYNGSVPADLDMIPVAGVERIEVLRDGAAAQYGSDAIAGVINLILNDNGDNSGEASFTTGQNFDRSDGEQFLGSVRYGAPLGNGGYLSLFADAKKQERSNRAIPISPTINLYPLVGGQRDPREATIDRLVTISYGNYPTEGFNVGYNASLPVGGASLYSFATYSQRDSALTWTFRAPNNSASLPNVYPDGFRPESHILELDYEGAIGIKGEISGWDYDLSSTYGRNRARQELFGSINASLGPTSPRDFLTGTLVSSEWVNSLDFTRGFAVGKNLQVSAGLQHRHETYAIRAGDPAGSAAGTYTYVVNGVTIRPAPGAQGAPSFPAADAGDISRDSFAGYLDVAWDPTERTTISGAVRYETYNDDSGDTLTGKLAARHEFVDWLSARGAVSTGFRAPALAQQLYASTVGQFRNVAGQLNLLQIKTLPVASPAAVALGAEPLTPETSTNISGGFVFQPLPNFNLTIDAYQIDVDDRIAITGTLTGAAVSAILVRNGLSPDISAQYYTNAIDTRTRGIDVVGTFRHDIGDATMNWSVSWNHNETKIRKIKNNPPELAALGAGFVLFDRLSQSNITVNLPKTKLTLANTTTLGDLSLTSRLIRFGAFKNFANATSVVGGVPVFGNDRSFGSKLIADAELSWQATGRLNVAIGANNLFNTYPDFNDASLNVNLGQGFYATSGAYGFTGGSYYARMRINF
jgi:iron complex outermembrane recepter protein